MARIKRCSNCEKRIASYDDSGDMESPADAIYNSHINGQGRQMVSQIEENGIYDTVVQLEELGLSDEEQLKIWKKYLRIKHR